MPRHASQASPCHRASLYASELNSVCPGSPRGRQGQQGVTEVADDAAHRGCARSGLAVGPRVRCLCPLKDRASASLFLHLPRPTHERPDADPRGARFASRSSSARQATTGPGASDQIPGACASRAGRVCLASSWSSVGAMGFDHCSVPHPAALFRDFRAAPDPHSLARASPGVPMAVAQGQLVL